jgi:tetratricopeptide (TPR) repeat protein
VLFRSSKPLVIILDNLHWADKPSLLLLEFLAPELVDSRLLVIGTYRDVDLSRQHPLVETLGELNRERLFERVLLRGLTEDDTRNFIEIVSGVTPPSGLVRTVHTQTEGNPLFLTEGAMRASNEALEIARTIGDAALELTALFGSALVSYYHLHVQDALDATQKVTKLSSKLDAPLIGLVSDYYRGALLSYSRNLKIARQSLELSLSTAERVRHRIRVAGAAAFLAWISMVEGDFDDARQQIDRALSLAPEDSVVLMFATLLDSTVGDFVASNAHIDIQLETINQTDPGPNFEHGLLALCIPFAAQTSGDLSQLRYANEVANAVVSSQNVTPIIDLAARIGLAVTAVLTDDKSETMEQYSAFAELKKSMPFLFISVDRLLGLLAHTMGNLDNSQTHFEDAIVICRESGSITELAWSLHDYADMLLERDGDRDMAKATVMLEEALQISTDLSMKPLTERIAALKKKPEA